MLHDKPAHTETNTSFPSLASPSWLVCMQNDRQGERGLLMIHTSSKYSCKSNKVFSIWCYLLNVFYSFFHVELRGTYGGHWGLCPPSQIPLHFSSCFKCKKEWDRQRERGRGRETDWEREWGRVSERERKSLREQRAAIYEKTKGPRPGSLKQKLADKGVCLCEQKQKGPWYVGIGEELSSWAVGGRLGPELRYFGVLLFPFLSICLLSYFMSLQKMSILCIFMHWFTKSCQYCSILFIFFCIFVTNVMSQNCLPYFG